MISTGFSYKCPYCGDYTNILVKIESHSDWESDTTCEHCNIDINNSDLDSKILNETNEAIIGQAKYYRD